MFVISVVVATILLIKPHKIARWLFLRDTIFYLIAVSRRASCLSLAHPKTTDLEDYLPKYCFDIISGAWRRASMQILACKWL